jgi:NhaA family Na+:H+ antiporter
LGILVFSWVAVTLRIAKLPSGVNWNMLVGGSCLAGIGFTMSLFIAGLALDGELFNAAKIGILVGSLLSAVVGTMFLVALSDTKKKATRS